MYNKNYPSFLYTWNFGMLSFNYLLVNIYVIFFLQDLREWQRDSVEIRKRRVKIEDCKWGSTSAVLLKFIT